MQFEVEEFLLYFNETFNLVALGAEGQEEKCEFKRRKDTRIERKKK